MTLRITFVDAGVLIAAARGKADVAVIEACKFGLNAMDAFHIAAAVLAGAEDFITTKKSDKPLHRVDSIHILSIRPL